MLRFGRDPFGFMWQLYQRHGDIAAISRGTTSHIFLFSPQYHQQVLADETSFDTLDVAFPLPVDSSLARLFTIPSQMHGFKNKQQRQVMFTILHKKYYEQYRAGIIQAVEQRLKSWHIGEQRDIFYEMNQLTFATPCQAFFNLDPDSEGKVIIKLIEQWGEALLAMSTFLLPFNIPTSSYRRLFNLSEQLETAYRTLIADKRRASLAGDDALLRLLKIHDQDKNHLSDAELIGQVNNLFNAGNTSRATVISWAMFLLSQHREALLMVRHELARHVAGQTPTLAQLDKLQFLEAVIKESMRLLPPVSWLSRRAMKPVQLAGYDIPEGATLVCSVFVTHRRADIYAAPHQFLPQRWLVNRPPAYGFIPTGAGPRMCVGAHFSLMEAKLILAIILQQYQLTIAPGTSIDYAGLMVSSPKRLPMRIGSLDEPDEPITTDSIQGNIRRWIRFDRS